VLSTKYHIASVMAIFFALGLGILIGGTLGQKWMNEAEHNVVDMLMEKVEEQATLNRELQKQMGSLQLMYRQIDPILQRKKILWVRPETEKNNMLSFMLQAVGAEWIEEYTVRKNEEHSLKQMFTLGAWPDIILTSDESTKSKISNELMTSAGESPPDRFPVVIDVSKHYPDLNDPEALVHFMMYLRQITESEAEQRATVDYYSDPGVE
jgi:hypothetical protein